MKVQAPTGFLCKHLVSNLLREYCKEMLSERDLLFYRQRGMNMSLLVHASWERRSDDLRSRRRQTMETPILAAGEGTRCGALRIGAKLRQLREQKGLSQGDIEKRAGLLRCYISRVENGYKLPSLETLERFAAALDIPLYRLFYDGSEPPPLPRLAPSALLGDLLQTQGRTGPETRFLRKFGSLWSRISGSNREILAGMVRFMASRAEEVTRTEGPELLSLPIADLQAGSTLSEGEA
jgi:transcriptional regulator with XRE-family HTH domain